MNLSIVKLELTSQNITIYRNDEGVVIHADFEPKENKVRYEDKQGHTIDLDVINELEKFLGQNV